MARRGSEITVPEETAVQTQSKSITRGRKPEITAHQQQSEAQAIEELEVAFDLDLRMAIIQRLVKEKEIILQQQNTERKTTEALEIARLEAMDRAREEGKQQARAKMAQKKREQKRNAQQHFIDVELEKLIDSCNELPYETMKQTIDEFASRLDVKLEWRELDDGKFECNASVA